MSDTTAGVAHAVPCGDRACPQQVCWPYEGDGQLGITTDSSAPPLEYSIQIAMTLRDRSVKMERCFVWLRTNFCALTPYQEEQLRKYMEVD